MSDKEPRRRKKRKDVQFQRKDDIRGEDLSFMAFRQESKDSDTEVENDISIATEQPTFCAKFVFFVLFSCIVISISFIFISLRGTKSVTFDKVDSSEHLDTLEESNGEHSSDHLHSDEIGDYYPSIKKFFTYFDEAQTSENYQKDDMLSTNELSEQEVFLENLSESFEIPVISLESHPEIFEKSEGTYEEPLEMHEELLNNPTEHFNIPFETQKDAIEIENPLVEVEYTADFSENRGEVLENANEALSEKSEVDTNIISENVLEEKESQINENDDLIIEKTHSNILSNEAVQHLEENVGTNLDENIVSEMKENLADPIDAEYEKQEIDNAAIYDKANLTNEADYSIRDQLDEVDDLIVEESFHVGDEDDNGDDDDDDEDDQNEDGSQEEFDFWQF